MGCRIGITTDLERRKQEWLNDYPNMTGWETFAPFDSKENAQNWENTNFPECDKHPGGDDSDDPNAEWSGYKFNF